MSPAEPPYQALAACGATIVAFVGVCHEVIGPTIFPWAPVLLGPVAWHGLGIFTIVAGLLVLGGTLRLIAFPVVPFALLAFAIGVVLVAFTAIAHHEFHFFALAAGTAGAITAHCHRKAALSAAGARP